MTTTIAMPSVTHAMKGQRVLRNAGLRCEVEKRKQPGGCIYEIVVTGAAAASVLKVLQYHNIPVLGVAEN